jgi:hypothetical protein
MNTDKSAAPRVWQVACGETGRDYRDVFLRHDLMLLGPGDPGPWSEDLYDSDNRIRPFVHGPSAGDVVLMRLGHEVLRVGTVPHQDEKYSWSPSFEEVLGWNLQHYRRVLWGGPRSTSVLARMQPVFSNYKQQRAFSEVHERRITRLADRLARAVHSRRLRKLPPESKSLTLEDFGLGLFNSGLSNDSVERALEAIEKCRRLGSWYQEHDGREPSEHEIVAHTCIPMMLALGWSEQMLAVEWRHIDLAFFDRMPTTEENCVMICEAKRPHRPLESALDQAINYVEKRRLVRCRTIVLSAGTRLTTYRKMRGGWYASGAINFMRLRDRHVIPHNTSAVETLMSLTPGRLGSQR